MQGGMAWAGEVGGMRGAVGAVVPMGTKQGPGEWGEV